MKRREDQRKEGHADKSRCENCMELRSFKSHRNKKQKTKKKNKKCPGERG